MKIIKIKFLLLFLLLWFGAIQTGYAKDKKTALIGEQKYSVNLITVNFKRIAVRDLLQFLTKWFHKNIIVSDKVKGFIAINLHGVSYDQALDYILKTKHLVKIEKNGIVQIVPFSEYQKENNEDKLPSLPHFFALYYGKAKDLTKSLSSSRNFLSKNGAISFDQRTNSLLVKDNERKIKDVQNYLNKVDMPSKQVAIDARIVFVNSEDVRELGFMFATKGGAAGNSSSSDGGVSMDFATPGLENPGHFSLALAKLSGDVLLDMELTALETEGNAKMISHPKLITSNLKPAYIESGEEIPYQEKAGEGATNIAFKKAALSLKVTPQVGRNNQIDLNLELNQDKVSAITVNGVPAIETRKIKTDVLVKNGATVALGGIYEVSENKVVKRIPFLSAIPILGVLFRHQQTEHKQQELLVFVTPKLL